MNILKEPGALTPAITLDGIYYYENSKYLQQYLEIYFKDRYNGHIIGFTPCAFERMHEQDAEVKTYALDMSYSKNVDVLEAGRTFIHFFIGQLGNYLQEFNLIIRRSPSITLEKQRMIISTRIAICPKSWTKTDYALHVQRRDLASVENKCDKSIDTE